MPTTNNCAVAAMAPRIRNVVHPGVLGLSRVMSGITAAAVAAVTITK